MSYWQDNGTRTVQCLIPHVLNSSTLALCPCTISKLVCSTGYSIFSITSCQTLESCRLHAHQTLLPKFLPTTQNKSGLHKKQKCLLFLHADVQRTLPSSIQTCFQPSSSHQWVLLLQPYLCNREPASSPRPCSCATLGSTGPCGLYSRGGSTATQLCCCCLFAASCVCF